MSHHSHLPPEMDEAVRSFIRRHKRGLRWGCLGALLLGLALVALIAWTAFHGALRVKDWLSGNAPAIRVPLAWEKPLGDAALAQMRGQAKFREDPATLEALNRLAAPLFAGWTNNGDLFTLYVSESRDINALALPGGYLVFHRGLLERARSAAEIQGVLAHEMAHVIKRHGTLQLAQDIGLGLIVQQLLGNESGILNTLIRDSGQLLGLKFSRDHERAADDLGWQILEQAGIDPGGMVDFFAVLKADVDAQGATGIAFGSNLLSTHPAPQERIDRLKQKKEALGRREYKTFNGEYQALRLALRPEVERP